MSITLASKRYTIGSYGGTLDSRHPDGDGIGTIFPEEPRYTVDTTYSLPTGNEWTATVTANNNAAGTGTGNRTDCGFQYALTNCALNDIITLTAGSTYTGPFTLPNKVSGSGWIYIRSSAHASLPAAGTRVAIADATNMPKIKIGAGVGEAIACDSGAHHYRFVGMEICPNASAFVYTLFTMGGGQTTLAGIPTDITIDRCYIHGDATAGSRRGIALDAVRGAVVDCYISDFKEAGADTQAVWLYNTPGPIKIHNNYLEGAGENFLTGGSDSSYGDVVPADITITGNYFFKPLSWMYPFNSATYWVVKNLFELKNGERILIEGNLFENHWAGQGQSGCAFLITCRNQSGTDHQNTTRDITIRHNRFKNICAWFSISGADDGDGNAWGSRSSQRIWIHDNEATISGLHNDGDQGGEGFIGAFLIGGGENTIVGNTDGIPAANLRIENNTIFATYRAQGAHLYFSGSTKWDSFYFRNNLCDYFTYGFSSATGGGSNTNALNNHFMTWEFEGNVAFPVASAGAGYPVGNYLAATDAAVGFTNYAAGNYLLTGASTYHNAGTDGTDIGCDIAALEAELND